MHVVQCWIKLYQFISRLFKYKYVVPQMIIFRTLGLDSVIILMISIFYYILFTLNFISQLLNISNRGRFRTWLLLIEKKWLYCNCRKDRNRNISINNGKVSFESNPWSNHWVEYPETVAPSVVDLLDTSPSFWGLLF